MKKINYLKIIYNHLYERRLDLDADDSYVIEQLKALDNELLVQLVDIFELLRKFCIDVLEEEANF